MLSTSACWRPAGWSLVLDGPALVRAVDSVVHGRLAVAVLSATSKLCVELLEHARGDLRYRHTAEQWIDVVPDVALVGPSGGLLDLQKPEPVGQCYAQGRFRSGASLLVDLDEQPIEDAAKAASESRPPRRYYVLTDQGRQQLAGMIRAAKQDPRFRSLDFGVVNQFRLLRFEATR